MPNIQYFLGANAPQGFYSLYDQLICPEEAAVIYILKGGPGCGKSTLMRRVARQAEQAGLPVEYILCSGDPHSLDAVVLPSLNAALTDGTAPHVVEPRYPGAVEQYVDLGQCYDRTGLLPLRRQIMECMADHRACCRRCTRCLAAAAQIQSDTRAVLLTDALCAGMAKRARGILSRELGRRKAACPGQVRQRFLSGITHAGHMVLFDTALAQCSRVYELADRYGLAHTMLTCLLPEFTAVGYDVVACPSPMAPDRLEHLLVPELGLAFLSSDPARPFPGKAYRRLRLDCMADPELIRRCRPRLRFARKVSDALLEEAVGSLAQAKSVHDDLEALYHPHVDFDRVGRIAEGICAQLFC